MDYGTWTLTCMHNKHKQHNIEIPGIISGWFCFDLPIILPGLPPDYSDENILNGSKLAYKADQEFQNKCDKLSLLFLYEVQQQQQHIDLINTLTQIPPEFYNLLFHLWGTTLETIDSLADYYCELPWHQQLIHYRKHTLKDIHKHVDGVPNLN